MIVVSVQYTDAPQTQTTIYNGGTSVIFQVISEAKAFAEAESTASAYGLIYAAALCRVYNDGVVVQAWLNGQNVTT